MLWQVQADADVCCQRGQVGVPAKSGLTLLKASWAAAACNPDVPSFLGDGRSRYGGSWPECRPFGDMITRLGLYA